MNDCKEMFQVLRQSSNPVKHIPIEVRSIQEVNSAIADLRSGTVFGRVVLRHDWKEEEDDGDDDLGNDNQLSKL